MTVEVKPQILLTPELKAKVEAKMKECFEIAEKHYGISFEFPEIRYNIKNWVGGLAYRNRNLVRYNLILLVENEEHYLATTVPHETAHMIVNALFRAGKFKLAEGKKRQMPHGREWEEVMGVINTPASVTHSYDCSSIERFPKPRRRGGPVDRVGRLMNQISRLSDEERHELIHLLTVKEFATYDTY